MVKSPAFPGLRLPSTVRSDASGSVARRLIASADGSGKWTALAVTAKSRTVEVTAGLTVVSWTSMFPPEISSRATDASTGDYSEPPDFDGGGAAATGPPGVELEIPSRAFSVGDG